MQLVPTTLPNSWTGLALLLSLLAAAIGALFLVSSNAREGSTAWLRTQSMSSTAVGADDGRLIGGSQRLSMLSSCQQCGAADPPHRCAGCAAVAYCSRPCQQKHWAHLHKAECRKLRDAMRQEEQAQHATPAPSDADEDASAASAGRPQESNSTLPVPGKVLYPSEAYAELAAAPPQREQPLGFQNVGNSCYANSLLQALVATPPLAAYLVSQQHRRGCPKPSTSDWCVLCELEKLAAAAYDADSGRVLNPKSLLRNVKRLGKQFNFGRQEDSHELYVRLLEAVEAVLLLEAGGRRRYDLRTSETTLIHHVFAGYTRTAVECAACGHASRTYECCTSLTLEVTPRAASLEAALRNFTAVERLDGANRYKCDGCKAYVAADKSTRVEAAPHVLQICLKRFGLGRHGKITSRLSFPEQLDLAPYMAAGALDTDAVLYQLYAVVVHIDWGHSTDHGHYIAYVRCGDAWFLCDDATVAQVTPAKVLAAGAYLLFYQRQAPRRVVAAEGGATEATQAGEERSEESVSWAAALPASPAAAAAEDAAEPWQAAGVQEDLPQEPHACSSDGDSEFLEQPSGHSELQQAAAMAAESARAEVEALQWELQAGLSGCSSGAATAASSPSSGRLHVSPGSNPFYLLESDDDAGSDSGSSREPGSDSDDSRAAGSGSDDTSLGYAWDDGDRMAGAAAELSAGRRAQRQGVAAAGGTHPALEPAVTQAGRQGRRKPVSTQHLQEQQPPRQQHPEGKSAPPEVASCAVDSGAEGAGELCCTPEHRASIGELAGRAVLRLSVDLPGVRHEEHVQWQMAPRRSSSAVQQLQLRANSFSLRLPLPVPVADGQATAEWLATSERLTITMPLSS